MATKTIEELLKSIPQNEFRKIEEIPEITRIRIKGIADLQKWIALERSTMGDEKIELPAGQRTIEEIYPISQRWEMIHAIGSAAHFWQLDRLPGGRWTWADDPIVCISDIWIQIYTNGWIIKANNALDVEAAFCPDAVAKIAEIVAGMHQSENRWLDAEIAKAATNWNPIFSEKKDYDRRIAKAARGIMQIARKDQKPLAECIAAGCAANNISEDGFRDALQIEYLERKNLEG